MSNIRKNLFMFDFKEEDELCEPWERARGLYMGAHNSEKKNGKRRGG